MASLEATYGAMFSGASFSYALYGIALVQFVLFCRRRDRGEVAVNSLVVFTWLMDTLQQCLITHALWYYLVCKSGGIDANRYFVNWSLQAQGIPSVILTLTVQWFFFIRLVKFSKRRWTFILFLPILAAFALSLYWDLRNLTSPTPLVYVLDRSGGLINAGTTALLATANTCCLIADVAISAIGCHQLYKHRSEAMGSSKGVVNTLIRYTLTTGLLSSIVTVLCLIFYVANAGVTFGALLAAYFVHAKLYVNCMLASLNNRERLRARVFEDVKSNLPTSRPHSSVSTLTAPRRSSVLVIAPGMPERVEPPPHLSEAKYKRSPYDSYPLIQ